MFLRHIAFLVFAAAGFAQTPETPLKPETIQLSRIRLRAVENLGRLPNYTCRETIERSVLKPPANRFQLVDTVRLEVALVKGKELFGWPGAEKFEEGDIGDMVKGGAIGNGNFASHARSIFMGGGARFRHAGESNVDGRPAIQWNFVMPQIQSRYMLRIGPNEGIAGYHGSFWVDPNTLDLIRLEVISDEIPLHLPLKIASDRMDYSVVKIGDSEFLLPKGSQMTMTDSLGNVNRNRTVFTNCRQYGTESTISFADPSPDVLPSLAAPLDPIVLPPGLLIMMSLDSEITSEKNAVGDEITATVSGSVKRGKQTIIPKGSKLKGRLTQMMRSGNEFLFSFEFNRVEFLGRKGVLAARLEDVGIPGDRSPPGVRVSRYLNTEFRVLLGKDGKQSHPAMVYVRGSRLLLSKGLRIILRTESAR